MRKLTLNALALISIFIIPIYLVFSRYGKGEEHTITVQDGMGIIPTAMISIIVIVGIVYLLSWLKGKLVQDTSGMFRIFAFGLILFAILFLGYQWVDTITRTAEANLNEFVASLDYHNATLKSMYISIGAGVLAIVINQSFEINIPQKLWDYFTK